VVSEIRLRDVIENDLSIFFDQGRDPAAVYMAAFTAEDPADKKAFDAHWDKIMADETILIKTILYKGRVAGHIASFERFGDLEVSYWLGKEYWGKGLATKALAAFLEIQNTRPLYARAAKDNAASIRVLEKCGFKIMGHDKFFANARGQEIDEIILQLR
jgi:RimJ/RimL family protein N-acetyltransferase